MPYSLSIGVYNSAGERVRQLFAGQASGQPSLAGLSASSLVPALGSVSVLLNAELGAGVGQASWNGTNDQGQAVAGGVYYIKVQATDAFGRTTSTSLPVQVLPSPAASLAGVDIYNAAGELVASLPLSSTGAVSGLVLLNGSVVPGRSSLQLQVTEANGSVQDLSWNGLGASGGAVQSGTYTLRTRGQGLGTVAIEKSFSVLDAPGTSATAPLLAPNPVPAGSGSLLVLAPGIDAGWSARLYTLAGELVTEGSALPGASVSLSLPAGRVSGGIYLVVARCRDASGVEWRWTLKAAVLR